MRLDPALLPVAHDSQAARGGSFADLERYYSTLEMQPLQITAHMLTPYVPTMPKNALNFDAILSFAVLELHPFSPHYDTRACVVPLPLECLWLSPNGLPLWAASMMFPHGNFINSREYIHRRYPSEHAHLSNHINAETGKGRWKDIRKVVPTVSADMLSCTAIGHLETVQELVQQIPEIGAMRKNNGAVSHWTVEPLTCPRAGAFEVILKNRPVPARYLDENRITYRGTTHGTWTPPYHEKPWSDRVCFYDD